LTKINKINILEALVKKTIRNHRNTYVYTTPHNRTTPYFRGRQDMQWVLICLRRKIVACLNVDYNDKIWFCEVLEYDHMFKEPSKLDTQRVFSFSDPETPNNVEQEIHVFLKRKEISNLKDSILRILYTVFVIISIMTTGYWLKYILTQL
jgi:hypothetical protein